MEQGIVSPPAPDESRSGSIRSRLVMETDFCSERSARADNEDDVGSCAACHARSVVITAIADGAGGAKGRRFGTSLEYEDSSRGRAEASSVDPEAGSVVLQAVRPRARHKGIPAQQNFRAVPAKGAWRITPITSSPPSKPTGGHRLVLKAGSHPADRSGAAAERQEEAYDDAVRKLSRQAISAGPRS
jgi:hypothetical protein